ncbi:MULTISPECIES: Sec-independent protein translocase TatC [unclassified Methanosarcina]|uniref:Sec-independent protein translocase TatC n=1 Tax=unclassified Methanosarcina TaxID=2644672 RepID=UPI000615C8A7|nr:MULTISPECIES: Sec-independent protein translocase TatC [unclassified Methanosarcina]AKB20122.1 Twin-arginine translocation protein TatC [Methanosarcina sp. WWM596]AKB21690.1 Twin-arginine translocation protein TatC [Methanosarcina sp. WH1]
MSEAIENLSVILLTLRKKLIVVAAVLFAGVALSFQFTGPLIERMKEDLLPEGAKLVYVSPLEVMMLKLKLSFIIGLLFAIPVIAFYAYRAVSRRISFRNPIQVRKSQFLLLSVAALVMFALGASYAYFFMLPLFLDYLYLNAAGSGVTATYSIFKFISFAAAGTALFGLIFELPIVLTFLTRNGFVQYSTLVAYRKHIYIVFLVVGAGITPPDVLSQIMVAVPMILFFEISMVFVRILGVKNKVSQPDSSSAPRASGRS